MDPRILEARLLERALQQGLIPEAPKALPAASGEASLAWGPRIQHLLETGALDEQVLHALMRDVLGNPEGDAPAPPLAIDGLEPPGPDPAGVWERFQSIDLVATGGEGHLYRAFDSLLQRWVALKFPRWEHADPERLLEEAKAFAAVQHPGIRPIYDAGLQDGRPYLVMRWIEGGSLHRIQPSLSLEEQVRLLADVAEAVAALHRDGLLHLDLKPGNVLLERNHAGGWAAFVSDFGLGRRIGDPSPPRGMGTPPYASPEQCRLEPGLDPRSDVYSLGVMLYRGLDAAEPEGPSSSQGRELAAIAQKAMAGAREARYPDAGALAEDLRSLLEHRPLSFRRKSPLYLSALALRRRPLLGAAAAGALALGSWGGYQLQVERRRADEAALFGRMLEEVVTDVNLSQLAPLHDRRPELSRIRNRMRELEGLIARLGPRARGPGYLALGKAHLLLDESAAARAALLEAEAAGAQDLQLDETLGKLRAQEFFRVSDTPDDERERRMRRPALAALRRVVDQHPDDLPSKVMVALLEGRQEDAFRLGRVALKRPGTPWNHGTFKALGEIWDGQMQAAMATSDWPRARRCLELFDVTLQRAFSIARSDPGLYRAKGFLCFGRAFLESLEKRPEMPHLIEALEAFETLDRIHPGADGPRLRIEALRRLGVARLHRGQDPEPAWGEADRLLEGQAGADGTWESWTLQAAVRLELARCDRARALGRNPEPHLAKARWYLDRPVSVRIEGGRALDRHLEALRFAWHARRAQGRFREGLDPAEDLEAMADLAEAARREGRPLDAAIPAWGGRDRTAFGPRARQAEERIRTALGLYRFPSSSDAGAGSSAARDSPG